MASARENMMTNVQQAPESTNKLYNRNVGSNTQYFSPTNRPNSSRPSTYRSVSNSPVGQGRTPKSKESKRIRRKLRRKSEYMNNSIHTPSCSNSTGEVQTKNSTIDEKFTYKINFVKNHHKSSMIRKRNSNYKYVNLQSFISNSLMNNCTFTTKMNYPTNNIKRQTDEKVKRQGVSKAELRKYPKQKSVTKRFKEQNTIDDKTFPEYMSEEDIITGLSNGTLVKGFVRINPNNSKVSYVSNDDSSKSDYQLNSILDRNRALEGDEVILQIKPKNEWLDGNITARVVNVTQKVHSRFAVGILKPNNSKYATFYPRDKRFPVMRIPELSWPNGFKDNPKDFAEILCMAQLLDWKNLDHACGVVTENLGRAGDLKTETYSILKEFGLDTTPFGEEIKQYLPQTQCIDKAEIERREDIRTQCVFTIDPATARDLDDAVSVKILPNGNYEVGVHISDVSYYLEEGTKLDQRVSKKATTIYMVDSVYHMLPVELCLHCSLLPGEDKLAFSVFWEITKQGDILNNRYTRTIINSCSKLAYEHAQNIIENSGKQFANEDFPQIHNGFQPVDIVNTVNILQSIAVVLREKRVQNGALKIEQIKLQVSLDKVTGEPIDYSVYENKESHRLIEEFMLLANISVAEKIHDAFPQMAFLRCHERPKQTMLVDLEKSLATYGIHLDISSSAGIRTSLEKYNSNDFLGSCRAAVLNHLIAKSMTRAKYFCAANVGSQDFHHYALSVPIYTHFTSPIRRYADVMVHRLLAASLRYQDPPVWKESYISGVAANCNIQKYNAKRAGEASIDLYLAHYIQNHQPYVQHCIVVDVKERRFDVIVMNTGTIVRIYMNNCERGTKWKIEDSKSDLPKNPKTSADFTKKQLRLTITFPVTKKYPRIDMNVEMFSIVRVLLDRKPNTYKLEGKLMRPT